MLRTFDRARRRARDMISIVRPNVPPIFLDCCGNPQPLRLSIDRPWITRGRLWATDGRIAVWADLDALHLSDRELALYAKGDRNVPNIEAIISDCLYEPAPARLPEAERWTNCKECGGTGRSYHDPDLRCYDCEGTGRWWDYRRCKLGGSDIYLMAYYVALLRGHGIDAVRIPLGAGEPIRFDKGPIGGLLMPMTPPGRPEIEAEKNANVSRQTA